MPQDSSEASQISLEVKELQIEFNVWGVCQKHQKDSKILGQIGSQVTVKQYLFT